MKQKTKETYGIIHRLVPGPGVSQRHRVTPTSSVRAEALGQFGPMVNAAMTDKDVLEIRLCRYTVGRTEIVSSFTREQLDMMAKEMVAA